MIFSKDFPNQLRSQIIISDLVGKKLALKKRGKDYLGLCPFHNEKTPSFVVNDQKGFYHCFGCSAHGDVISFVMQVDGFGFKEAVIKLADDYGIKVPVISEKDKVEEDKNSKYYEIVEQACQYFENNLYDYSSSFAVEYLFKRNLDKEIIKKFRLGFASSGYNNLSDYLNKKQFTQRELLDSGLVFVNDNNSLCDRFRGRIIFPISDKLGRIIAFGGRVIGDAQPKYLNSPETEFFKKGQNLYNYSRARKAIYDRKFVVVVEGYMDVISLSRYKIENVVAPLGTSITVEQLKDLFKITSEIIIFLDGDVAGIKASRRVIDITLPILNPKNIVRFAFLPNGVDPDDFIKVNGSKAVEDLLAQAKNLSEVLLEYEAKDLGIKEINRFTSPEKKSMLETRLMDKINLITDPNSKKHFSQYYRNIVFGFSKKNDGQTLINSKNNFLVSALNQSRILDSEFIYGANIIAILIKHPDLIDYKNEYYDLREVSFFSEELNNIKESLVELWDKNRVVNDNRGDLESSLEEICLDYRSLKEMMPSSEKISDDFNEAKQKLEIFSLKLYYEKICQQYKESLELANNIETDSISITDGKHRVLFDHKTFIEKKIIQLENKLFEK